VAAVRETRHVGGCRTGALQSDAEFARYPYLAKAGSPTAAGRRRTRAARAGMAPAVSWS
jgi:hypothetical protein